MSSTSTNQIRQQRLARQWSQQDLADRAGLSRAGVSAIEAGRLAPSVTAALALGRALGCTVEELFGGAPATGPAVEWASPPGDSARRYWQARVGDRHWAYPIEEDAPQLAWHDGVWRGTLLDVPGELASRTLVVACCDPAGGLLAGEYARQFGFRLLVLRRSSREALAMLAAGKVHVAGIHLGGARRGENSRIARAEIGKACHVVRGARWDEGVAVGSRFQSGSLASAVESGARWVGREEGSGARQCQDQVLGDRPAPKRIAFDHRGVATAVKCGWADLGPCVRFTSEEAGLGFFKVQEKDFDFCFADDAQSDGRLAAFLATLRSRHYRTLLGELPGYSTSETGELV